MNLRFVEAFYWVASLQSVSRAAERLFVTQSAMSSRIAALEEELGTLLLDRRDKSFRLTLAGTRFLEHAKKMLDLQRIAKAELSGGAVAGERVLRVGAIESVMHSWLTAWLSEMRETHQELAIELTVETTPLLLDHVQRGVIDLVFAASPSNTSAIQVTPMPPMPMVFLGHKRAHRQKRYSIEQTAAHDLLTFQRGSQPYVSLVETLHANKIDFARIHAVSSISAMVELVEARFGIAVLPRSAAMRLLRNRDLHLLTSDLSLPPLTIFASHRVDPNSIDLVDAIARSKQCALREEKRPKPLSRQRISSKKSMT